MKNRGWEVQTLPFLGLLQTTRAAGGRKGRAERQEQVNGLGFTWLDPLTSLDYPQSSAQLSRRSLDWWDLLSLDIKDVPRMNREM